MVWSLESGVLSDNNVADIVSGHCNGSGIVFGRTGTSNGHLVFHRLQKAVQHSQSFRFRLKIGCQIGQTGQIDQIVGLLGQVDLANIGKLVHIDIHNDTGTGVVYGRCLLRDFGLEEASADEGGSL